MKQSKTRKKTCVFLKRAVHFTALVAAAGLLTGLFTGCPQKIDGGPSSGGGAQSGPDPNLRIEGTVLMGYNEIPAGVLNIPAGVTEIAGSAFENCTSLTSVNFPSSLKKIGGSAFYGCTGLTSLALPASLEHIGSQAFGGCTEIAGTVSIPAHLKTIGYAAFSGCKKVSGFDFSSCTQLTSIGDRAFSGCTAATYKVKSGSSIRNLLLNSQSGITLSQIIEE
ncbi:leucine-rich repeat domain-containing protein [Treponema sp. OMZ 840]|uniref:leucine-rich repeat domain-containing protein n=1 Tax=Treponema sp. OMZ 840 TaxID=244313 RepID=UPI003D8A9FBB